MVECLAGGLVLYFVAAEVVLHLLQYMILFCHGVREGGRGEGGED